MSLFEIQFKNSLPLTNPRLNFAEKTLSYADLYIKAFPKNQKLLDFTNLLKDLLYKSVSLGNIITNFTKLTSNEDKSTLLANISVKAKELYEQYPNENVRLLKDLSSYACLLEVLYNELNKIIQSLPKPSRPSSPKSSRHSSIVVSPDSATTLVNFGSTLKRSLTKKGGKRVSRKSPRKTSKRTTKRNSKRKTSKRTTKRNSKRKSPRKTSKRTTKRTTKRKSPRKTSNRTKRKSPRKTSKRTTKRTFKRKSPRKTSRK